MPEDKQQNWKDMPEIPEEEKMDWLYQNMKRLIVYVNTLENWRHAKFKSLDQLIKEASDEQPKETNDSATDGKSAPVDSDSNKSS